MKVMVVETDRHAGTGAVEALREAGHEVLRCHEPGEPAWPCAALRENRTCPLDQGVDVVLTVRARPYPRPTATEDGVSCGLRRYVPLVVAGTSALNPFEAWVTIEAHEGDVVAACEGAVDTPLSRHTAIASVELRRQLRKEGREAKDATALARRRDDRIRVAVTVPGGADRRLADLLAVRIEGAVRSLDPYAAGVDVSVAAS